MSTGSALGAEVKSPEPDGGRRGLVTDDPTRSRRDLYRGGGERQIAAPGNAFFCTNRLFACDCIMYPVEKYIDTPEYIVLAQVVKVEHRDGTQYYGNNAVVKATKVYKGGLKKDEIIEFDSDESDCSFKFEENKNYLLFCYRLNNKFYVYHCSYSDELGLSLKNIRKIERYIAKHPRAPSRRA